jgi:hypothetical protein
MLTFKQFVIEADKKDTIIMDIPLMIRVLELAREDIKTDMDLHRVVEKLIDIRNKGVLTMDDYDFIANIKKLPIKEDGIAVPGPTNVVGGGAIAGSGGKGGEPGVYLKKKRDVILTPTFKRNTPKM